MHYIVSESEKYMQCFLQQKINLKKQSSLLLKTKQTKNNKKPQKY